MTEGVAVVAVAGVAIAGCTLALAVGGLILRAVFAHEARPLREGLIELKDAIANLSELLRDEVVSRKAEQGELREILIELQKISSDHEVRLTVLEQPIPPAAAARRRRAS